MATVNCLASETLAKDANVVVLSDLHVVAPKTLKSITIGDGERKMLRQSLEIFTATIDSIISIRPRYVFITGDLTDRGDRASHDAVKKQLERLATNGISTIVVPGNHDLSTDFTAEDFASTYDAFGYGQGARLNASLNYVCEPFDNVTLLCLDSSGDCRRAMAWATQEAAKAKAQGKVVMALMHNHLMPHFNGEGSLLATSVADAGDSAAVKLMNAGVHLVFTGHTHIHDAAIKHNASRNDSIVDVCTGALSGYPHPYRVINLNIDNKTVTGDTRYITSIKSMKDLPQKSSELIKKSIPTLVKSMAKGTFDKYGEKIKQMTGMLSLFGFGTQKMFKVSFDWESIEPIVEKRLLEPTTQLYLIASEGNENLKDTSALRQSIKDGISGTLHDVLNTDAFGSVLEMVTPELGNRLNPMIDAVLSDLNEDETIPFDDLRFSMKL